MKPFYTFTLKTKKFYLLLLTIVFFALMNSAQAADEPTRKLIDIKTTTLPGERLQISLEFNEPAIEPLSFTIDNPARIALDFDDTDIGLKKKIKRVGVGVTSDIITAAAKGRTRVIINMSQLVGYETQVIDNNVLITLEGAKDKDAIGSTIAAAGQAAASLFDKREVSKVDFRRGSEGEGRVLIKLSDPNTPIDLKDQLGTITLDILRTNLPNALERRLDVIDFATPVSMVDTFQDGDNIKMVIKTTGEYEQLAYQSGDTFIVEIKPLTKEEEQQQEKDRFSYTGEKLSLNFQDIEVRSVLQLISDFTGLNVVVSDSVSGNLTLRLKNVPWDQALDIILKTKGLAMRRNDNVVLIAPQDEIAAREKLELEAQQQVQQLSPLRSELIQVNYAQAQDMANLLTSEGNSILSDRGSVSIDERTNILIVNDTSEKLENIRRLIKTLDIPVRQVLIESRIVTATDRFSKDLGVRFGVTSDDSNGALSGDVGLTSGSLGATTSILDGETIEFNDRMNVNLPVTNPAGSIGIALAKLPLGTLLELELSAAEIESRAEVLSSPRVITSNQTAAKIQQGVEIPYAEASSSGAATIAFKEAELSLEVTPQITPDDRVFMQLEVHKDQVGQEFSGIPSIDTREVSTEVLVDNGQTIVLGGIYEQTTNDDVTRVPFFADIPLIGKLFQGSSESEEQSELLIFVTPKIVNESLSLAN